jgi:hypothetical protein
MTPGRAGWSIWVARGGRMPFNGYGPLLSRINAANLSADAESTNSADTVLPQNTTLTTYLANGDSSAYTPATSGLTLSRSANASANFIAPAPPVTPTTTVIPDSTPNFSTFVPAPAATVPADAFINLGTGPYPETGTIASGNPQPWYASASISHLFGGTPSASQQADFADKVLRNVEQTFQLSGVPVNLTTDPGVAADHTLSVVSNSSSIPYPNSIGTTTLGGDGFSFIDPIAKSSQSLDQLEWIVAHNVAHELMLSFGVPEDFDQTGKYIDATNASWNMMTSPTAVFSPAAADAINQALQADATSPGSARYAQVIDPEQIPEPTTLLAWSLGALAVAARWRQRRSRNMASVAPLE